MWRFTTSICAQILFVLFVYLLKMTNISFIHSNSCTVCAFLGKRLNVSLKAAGPLTFHSMNAN